MLLSSLMTAAGITAAPPGSAGIDVTGITADSRKAAPGVLFAALSGSKADGAKFIADAAVKGAVAVLAAETASVPDGLAIPVLRAPEPRRALALMAAAFYARQPEVAVAVTGTSGKTSVAEFTRQLFAAAGRRAASLGTIGLVKPDGAVYGSLTTPDPVTLHETLAALAAEGISHLAFEASSHGLDQYRLDGVKVSAGAFTNLGRDHLDYHPTTEAYLAAKLRLFEELLPPGAPAVVNADGARAGDVVRAAEKRGLRLVTVGAKGETVRLEKLGRDGFAQTLTVRHAGRTYDVRLPLIGTYQVENALVAAGLAIAVGEDPAVVIPALEGLSGVKGRLEIVGEKNGALAVVDYAHKPEALEAALDGVRPFVTGKLICVFGCGGDRDRGKRPIMGAISAARADVTIVTDDNPRTEEPAAIRAEILAAAPSATEVGDRAEAIRTAVRLMQPGDVVLVAGKGHETGQIVGQTVIPFSDHDCLRAALAD
ncbi:MAG TPA: UDP-N-acetylmuramoyl-L-alanyl-D-glutamate--2,6-diaminopimelate ligase [Hyphomicrobium zavarzinii]|uniref:UDP-N-acetylmuramoyl-L-alanyl-D-glutamate--2, 6-diaminopimelate ligase n=1 Tax=Hyphomicrobium sp. DMF-1 TaxID=3019544 RepID=UPI0022EBE0F6|nr:UDP-N-acetylmuramoyl-L-alanyl-D-glutamate--2,6-diaminopimelate ligase [Hyphomicrobium sp. DMF-1]WBT37627.1 UDP-N-acetylmuramoyl-L-alanyl-D-glutamate--2,6-diaminopimelate ligase [Hyphomicrobium sp. DMF-1]HML41575.1 UDP-N-acetylmuramoyl-L-alanyl-D-glutamate--2,6-diaminopimelate ligase [Hyphomicrobium zavarzinii]